MIDLLNLPDEVTFTLGRKDILRGLWSNYTANKCASAMDHAHYLALDAAMSRPENQEVCFQAKMQAAFRPSTKPIRWANGYQPYLYQQNFNGVGLAQRTLQRCIADRAAGKVASGTGFISFAFNSVPIEALARALELLKRADLMPIEVCQYAVSQR